MLKLGRQSRRARNRDREQSFFYSVPSTTPRVLVIGDIGQHTYHVGDEAMTIASAQALSEGGAAGHLMTRDVGHSARYIGTAVNREAANHEVANHEVANHEAGAPYEYLPFFLFPGPG